MASGRTLRMQKWQFRCRKSYTEFSSLLQSLPVYMPADHHGRQSHAAPCMKECTYMQLAFQARHALAIETICQYCNTPIMRERKDSKIVLQPQGTRTAQMVRRLILFLDVLPWPTSSVRLFLLVPSVVTGAISVIPHSCCYNSLRPYRQ